MKVYVSTQRKIIASAFASTFTLYHKDNVNAKNMINQTQSYVKTVILELTMTFA